jgi:hypothetical protein
MMDRLKLAPSMRSDVIAVSRDITELFGDLIGILSENARGQITIEHGPKLSLLSRCRIFSTRTTRTAPC